MAFPLSRGQLPGVVDASCFRIPCNCVHRCHRQWLKSCFQEPVRQMGAALLQEQLLCCSDPNLCLSPLQPVSQAVSAWDCCAMLNSP